MHVWVIQFLHSMLVSNLWRIVYCLNIDAYSLWIIRVSGEITIKITKPLLIVASPLPESNKFTKFFMIHEGEIINMPVDLSTKDDSWWSTLSTNSFWVWLVARWTFVIYFIALLHRKCLEIQLVFLLQFLDIAIETLMLKLPNSFCKTVNALPIRWMSALWLILFHHIFSFLLFLLFLVKFLLFLSFLLLLFFFFLFLFFL